MTTDCVKTAAGYLVLSLMFDFLHNQAKNSDQFIIDTMEYSYHAYHGTCIYYFRNLQMYTLIMLYLLWAIRSFVGTCKLMTPCPLFVICLIC